jgi:hypothetical protein
MDLESYRLWWEYTKAYDDMFAATDSDIAPWYIVRADCKRRARLNCISHLLSHVPYEKVPAPKTRLPRRKKRSAGVPLDPRYRNWVPQVF